MSQRAAPQRSVAGAVDGRRPGYEYQRVWLPHDLDREGARVTLAIHASYGEWELMRSRVYPDGRRWVELRRRSRPGLPPYLPT